VTLEGPTTIGARPIPETTETAVVVKPEEEAAPVTITATLTEQ
jgi:hypothetical protein